MTSHRVAVNDQGRRIGQSHPQAKLTDRDVELLLALRDGGWTYKALAEKFDVSKSQVRNICTGRKRSQLPADWRVVVCPADRPRAADSGNQSGTERPAA